MKTKMFLNRHERDVNIENADNGTNYEVDVAIEDLPAELSAKHESGLSRLINDTLGNNHHLKQTHQTFNYNRGIGFCFRAPNIITTPKHDFDIIFALAPKDKIGRLTLMSHLTKYMYGDTQIGLANTLLDAYVRILECEDWMKY